MRYIAWICLAGLLALFALAGCENSPKDLPKEFVKGKCAICGRTTKVAPLLLNPETGYSLHKCWRPECEQELAQHKDQYIDKTKMPDLSRAVPTPAMPSMTNKAAVPR